MVGSRGPYERISPESRYMLISAFKQNENWLDLATQLGIKRQTARSIVANWQQSGRIEAKPRGGSRGRLLSSNQVESAVRWTKVEPQVTLNGLRSKLIEENPDWRPCALQTISRAINDEVVSFTTRSPVTPKCARSISYTKALRHDYADWLLTEGVVRNLVFCAEVDCHLCPTKSLDPQLVFRIAISPKWGIVHWRLHHTESFTDFIIEVATLVNRDFALLFDAPENEGLPAMNPGQDVRSLPRDSTFLNIAERAIESVRTSLKQRLMVAIHTSFDKNDLRECLEQEVTKITAEMCEDWFNATMKFLPKCLKLLDIDEL